MYLTNALKQDYDFSVTAKKAVIRVRVLFEAAISRLYQLKRLFLCLSLPVYGRAEQGSQDRWCLTSTLTCSVPPTLFRVRGGGSLNELEAHIMTNIIPVVSRIFRGKPTQAINARDFCSFLSISTPFHIWIKRRISEYGFEENFDYLSYEQKCSKPKGGRNSLDYFITLDMAKELAMVERTEKGREARRYFIECEKQLKTKQPAKALPIPKKYSYPRRLLEQSGFIAKGSRARLNISMLAHKNFISPLFHLLNELRTEGHDVDAPWDEAIAMRDGIMEADEVLTKITLDALGANHKTASTALDR